jgi:hypothetical protein
VLPVALESIPTPISGSMSQLDKKTHHAFLVLGITGVFSTIILWVAHTIVYLEYIRLYNLDPMNWTALEPIINLLNALGQYYIIPAMLVALGFYAVIISSDGKYSLLFVFIMLYPLSFNIYEVMYNFFSLFVSYEFVLSLDAAIQVGGAVLLGLILLTTRYQIKKPMLLYIVIILMILNPIINFVMYLLVWNNAGIASSALQYFILNSPNIAVYFLRLIAILVLFFIEYRRENLA